MARRSLGRKVAAAIGTLGLVMIVRCGHIIVRAPADDQPEITSPFSLQAQKLENPFCYYAKGSFRAFLDKGRPSQNEITSAFVRPADSHIWTAADFNLPTGSHTLNVEAAFGGALCWAKRAHDTQSFSVATAVMPDLIVADLQVVPGSPTTADPTSLSITVRNQGAAPAAATTVRITVGGASALTMNTAYLTAGHAAALSAPLAFPAPGSHLVEAHVDPTNAITEVDEANNRSAKTVVVRDCSGGDLEGALQAARERILRGDASADLDGDCRDEYSRSFDAAGSEIREAIDLDGDGGPEIVWDKSGLTKSYAVDGDEDGVAELTLTATPRPANTSVVDYVRSWDESGDGRPDRRILYSIDPARPTYDVRHESDIDQDGTFTFEHTSSAETLQSAFYEVVTAGPGACSAPQRAAIDSAFYDAWHDGAACLRGMDVRMAMTFLRNMGRYTFEISCDTSLPSTTCARAADAHEMESFFGPPDRLRIQLNPTSGFDGSCGSLTEVVFHELMHYAAGLHEYGNGHQDPGDRIYACVKTCFGVGNSISCAACLDKRNGTAACNSYAAVPCPVDVPTYCRCNGTIYPTAAGCAGSCPTSLGCFTFQCSELGPCR